jgi:O-antigen/teichoic acid export membrane protein
MIKNKINKYINQYKNSQARTKLLVKNIIAGFFIKGGSVVCMLLLVPLTIDFVDIKQYGIWLTLSSIIGWASFFDVGLGHGLRNRFAEALALNQKEQAKHYVSSAYFILGSIVVALAIVFTIVNPFINWATVLAAPQDMAQSLTVVSSVVVYSFLLQLQLKLITSMLMASQLQAKASLVSLIGNVLSLVLIFIATKTLNGNLLFLAAIFSVIPTLVLLGYNIYFFSSFYKEYKPSVSFVRKSDIKSLFGIGSLFFIIQIAAIVQFQTANILIAHWFSSEDVAVYNVCYKYFSVITMSFSLIVAPYWSAFTEAYSKNDINWIKKIVAKTVRLWVIFSLGGLLLLIFAPIVFKVWIGDRLEIPFILSLFMLIYVLLLSFGSIFVMFINGIGKVKTQTITSFISPILFLVLAYFFVKFIGIGIAGIVLAIIIANFYGPIIAPIQYYKIVKR